MIPITVRFLVDMSHVGIAALDGECPIELAIEDALRSTYEGSEVSVKNYLFQIVAMVDGVEIVFDPEAKLKTATSKWDADGEAPVGYYVISQKP